MFVVYTVTISGDTRIIARCDQHYDAINIVMAYRKMGYTQTWCV